MTAVAFRPSIDDVRHVAGLVGRVLLGIGALHVPAIVVALGMTEWNDATAMVAGAATAVLIGATLSTGLDPERELAWAEGMVTVAMSWLLAPLPVSVSLFLAGNAGSLLDGFFEAMSGLTTSGLSVLQDIDHAGAGIQLLRHLTHFAGGQGIILVVLMLLASGGPHVGTLLAGEGREERLLPNAVRTARFIYTIAAIWGVVGTAVLFVVLQIAGFDPWRALLHAAALFMAAFDTGGFSIPSTSIAYYHSALVEGVLVVLMVAGALSFPLHHQLWQRRVRSAVDNFDLRTFALTTALFTVVAVVALAANSIYDTTDALTRKGTFTVISAATGTGFGVVAAQAYGNWGQLAPAVVVVAMAFGAMAGSTAGGIKTVRIGLVAKSVLRDVRAALTAESGMVVATYHARRRRIVTAEQVAGAVIVMSLFLASYIGGALVPMFHGASLENGLFESVSAAANVGLSTGITGPAAPVTVKLVQILQMWTGRLEFLAVLALVVWIGSMARAERDRVRAHA